MTLGIYTDYKRELTGLLFIVPLYCLLTGMTSIKLLKLLGKYSLKEYYDFKSNSN